MRTNGHGFHTDGWFYDAVVVGVEAVRPGTGDVVRVGVREPRYETVRTAWTILTVDLRVVPDKVVRVRYSHDLGGAAASTHRMVLVNRHGPLVTALEDVEGNSLRGCAVARCHNARFLCTGGGTRTLVRRLSDAHTSIASLWPVEMLFMLGYRNVEVFTSDSLVPLAEACRALRDFHRTHGGHTEFRSSKKRRLAIDVALTRGMDAYWTLLHTLGVRTVSLHPGKFQPEELGPLRVE